MDTKSEDLASVKNVENTEQPILQIKNPVVKVALQDWEDLDKDLVQLERYRLKKITEALKPVKHLSEDEEKAVNALQMHMLKKKSTFRDYEDNLPHRNGLYLNIILGQVNISLLNKEDKYLYKQDYERFKLTLSNIILILSLLLVLGNYIVDFSNIRWADSILHFLLVWYYCTLTIREQILIVNGSRIKGWWVLHHFVSTACSAITLIWPDSYSYMQFRTQYGWFILYVAFVQLLQYQYQKGCLYRLKCLGQRHDMDVTVEGFMSWMFKGLSYLLPFLFMAYLYNAVILYQLSYDPRCTEWQVPVLAIIHLILFLGNMSTTLLVLKQKFTEDIKNIKKFYKTKYRFNNSKPKIM
ncbi:TM120-like protein [Mya arenaria]|uniref:TM120-like protein n=1 Tax=Mya arenaria TaxID=6604 RepID=A0ABY7E3R4_MYAAR|nr:TM120-like protein [Mya arenaria]